MKKGFIWIILTCLMVISMVLASCKSSSTTETTSTTNITPSTTTSTTSTAIVPTSTTSTAVVTTAVTTTSTGKWWDSLGTPQYGGTFTFRVAVNISNFDDANPLGGQMMVNNLWEDSLVCDDWTVNPADFAYQLNFRPANYEVGDVASDWEFSTPTTLVMHLNQNVYWQNLPPLNGRQFVASDVAFFYDRLYGLGMGYTTPISANSAFKALLSVTATDKYTVAFNWTPTASEETICETMYGPMGPTEEAPETYVGFAPAQLQMNWHNIAGTGPFMLKDWVDGTQMKVVRNPSYWGHDERHPNNQLPYVDGINILVIASQDTASAALRAGKIVALDLLNVSQANNFLQTNSNLVKIQYAGGSNCITVDPVTTATPYTDIRVRQALQMSLNLPEISSTYFMGAASPVPVTFTSPYLTGWSYPYSQWPASLKATYDFNQTGAKALLAAAGYPSGFTTNIVASSGSDLGLLQIIQSAFASIGVTMSISTQDPVSFNAFTKAFKTTQLNYGTKRAYSFPPLMGFRHWVSGNDVDWGMVNDPAFAAIYAQALVAPTVSATQALVVQGNQYFAAQQWNICVSLVNTYAVTEPYFKGYNAESFSINGTSSILEMGFYCSRFWIDKSLQ